MSKVMMLGDSHGDTAAYLDALEYCVDEGIQHVIQLGDCGLFPAFLSTQFHIDAVQTISREANITNWWVRGNHDSTDAWQATIDNWPGPHGSGRLRNNIYLLPRTRFFKHFGLNFLAVGGAVSVDRQWRLQKEKQRKTLWWPDEAISEKDVFTVKRLYQGQNIDVLLSHECSNNTPWNGRLKPDLESQMNRQRLDDIIKAVKPDWHFHGHMHTQYDWMNRASDNHWVRTIGLECNEEGMESGMALNNWFIFDTEKKDGEWRNGR